MRGAQRAALRVVVIGVAGAAALVGLAHQRELRDAGRFAETVAAFDQLDHRFRAQLVEAVHVEVLAARDFGELAVVGRDAQSLAQAAQGRDAGLLVADVFRQHMRRRQRLAEVVGQRGEADQVVARRQLRGDVADQLDMHAGVDLGVELGALRHAVQRVHFRQHHRQRGAVVQRAQERRRPRAGERAPQLLPDALGHERGEFAAGDHLAHQRQRFRRNREAQRREARHEARRAKHPQRVLDERVADVAQHARLQVARAAVRIDQCAVVGLRDRVDGEVATAEVVFQRYRRIGIDDEAAVAAPGFALGARECVFLAGGRVQEHRKIAPDRLEAGRLHRRLGLTDDDVVAVARFQAEQPIAHRAADEVGLHGRIVIPSAIRNLLRF